MRLDDARHAADQALANTGLAERGWTFRFDNAPRRFGQCRHDEKVITLSRHCTELNGWDEVWETILHEVAHALAGPGHGHDSTWWDISRRLGCKGGARHRAPTRNTNFKFTFLQGDPT